MNKDIHFLYCFGGNGNFGDDYILREWIDYILTARSDLNILAGVTKSWMQSAYFGQRVYFNDFIVQASLAEMVAAKKKKQGADLSIDERIEAGRAAAMKLLDRDHPWNDVLRRIRAFHLAGGGYVNEIFPAVFAYLSTIKTLAQHLEVPLYGTGLGLLPINSLTSGVSELLSAFDLLECRDEESYELMVRQGLASISVNGIDDTFLTPVRTIADHSRQPGLFINIQNDLEGNYDRYIDEIAKTVRCMKDSYHIRYLHFYRVSDDIFFKRLRDRGVEMIATSKNSLFAHGLPFRPGDLVLTTRFHCHLLAARCGAKGVYAIGKKGYYDVKHRSLVALGTNWADVTSTAPSPSLFSNLKDPQINEEKAIAGKKEIAGRILR